MAKRKSKNTARNSRVNAERRDEIIARLDQLNFVLEGDKKTKARAWKPKETKEVKRLNQELKEIDEAIKLERKTRKALQNKGSRKQDRYNPDNSEENKIKKRYSITRAIRIAAGKEKRNGLEGEMHKEAVREANASGYAIEGVGIPSIIAEKRSEVEVATPDSAGNLVATELANMVPHLRPELVLQKLGAQVITGVVGNLDIPVGDQRATVAATGEKGTAQKTKPTTRMVQARPHRYSGTIPVTSQMLIQSSIGMDQYISNQLRAACDEKINLDCIMGGGVDEISGILSSITPSSLGPNGLKLTRDHLLEMEERIDDSNAIDAKRSFLITNQIKRLAKGLKVDDGSGKFLFTKGMMIDYEALATTLMPNDVTKGTSIGVCSAIILANFSRYVMVNWGAKDLIWDPYTRKDEGIQEVTINSFWDGFVTHPQAFDAYVDVLTA